MEIRKKEHLDILNGSEPTVRTDGVVVPSKVVAPFVGKTELLSKYAQDPVFVTSEMLTIEPRHPGGLKENYVSFNLGDEVVRINLYGKLIFLSDDNYIVVKGNNTIYLIENTLTNKDSDVVIGCVGSHGGKNNACDTCLHNREEDPEGYRQVYISTMACELSEFYFSKPYWFQQRIAVMEIH